MGKVVVLGKQYLGTGQLQQTGQEWVTEGRRIRKVRTEKRV